MKRLRVIVEADGGSRGNPGPAGYGAVVREAGTEEVLVERAEAIGVATNNVAEYSGLIAGLQAAADLGAVEVEARMDSRLVVEQMSGRWQIKHPGLRPLAAQAASLVRRFDTVRFTWVPRERNRHADALANAAMNGESGVENRDVAGAAVMGAAAVDTALSGAVSPTGPVSGEGTGTAGGTTGATAWTPPAVLGRGTRLIMVRHGETEFNAERRYSGRGDVALSAFGQAQANAVAERVVALADQVDAVITSPLARCRRTAEVVAAAVQVPRVRAEPDLIECDFGAWEGRTFAEVRQGWPAELDTWLASVSVAPPGGESFDAVARRVRRALTALVARSPGQTVVLVSHVSPIKIILRDALLAGDQFLHRLFLDPAGISVVDFWPDGGVAVRAVNDTAHLAGLVRPAR